MVRWNLNELCKTRLALHAVKRGRFIRIGRQWGKELIEGWFSAFTENRERVNGLHSLTHHSQIHGALYNKHEDAENTFRCHCEECISNELVVNKCCAFLVHDETNGVELEELKDGGVLHFKANLIWRHVTTINFLLSLLRSGEGLEGRHFLFQNDLTVRSHRYNNSFAWLLDGVARFQNALSSRRCHHQSSCVVSGNWSAVMDRKRTHRSARSALRRYVERIAAEPRFHRKIERDALKRSHRRHGRKGGERR